MGVWVKQVSGEEPPQDVPAPTAEDTPAEDTPSAEPTTTKSVEQQALEYFVNLTGFWPSTSAHWAAHACIVNDGCYDVNNRNLKHEQEGILYFQERLDKTPKTTMDWNAVHAIAYTEVFVKHASSEETPQNVSAPTAEGSENSVEQQALEYFVTFTGKDPVSEADWVSHECIAYDTCLPSVRDTAKESLAVDYFVDKTGRLPSASMDWNAVHALAYTEALSPLLQ